MRPDRLQRSAQAEVVRQAAVEQMNEGAIRGIQIGAGFQGLTAAARRSGGVRHRRLDPNRPGRIASSRVVSQRDRAQQDREGRRSRHGAAQGKVGEVRAEQIKLVLGELETRAARHVRGVDH